MNEIKWERIYDYVKGNEALHSPVFAVLADRLWPRGVKREKAGIDLWAKDITPSSALRMQYHKGLMDYDNFSAKYREELENNPNWEDFINAIKEKLKETDVVILFASKTPQQSHIPTLKKFVEDSLDK